MELERCRNEAQLLDYLNNAIDEIKELKRTIAGIHSDGSIRISPNLGFSLATYPPVPRTNDPFFWAKITGNTVITAGCKWSYSFVEVKRSGSLYTGSWDTLTGGISSTAYNMCEIINTATGVCGNGINAGNLSSNFPSFSIKAIPTNSIVLITPYVRSSGTEYWFNCVNGIDGTCE